MLQKREVNDDLFDTENWNWKLYVWYWNWKVYPCKVLGFALMPTGDRGDATSTVEIFCVVVSLMLRSVIFESFALMTNNLKTEGKSEKESVEIPWSSHSNFLKKKEKL